MPRPNQPRDVFAEEHLAHRIKLEREKRGWTYEGLAQRMTDVGCPINQSALYKVEQAQPRRRITVDELVALARVFDIPVQDLLTDPKLLAFQQVIPLLTKWRQVAWRRSEAVREADRELADIQERLKEVSATSPDAAEAVQAYWQAWAEDEVASLSDENFEQIRRYMKPGFSRERLQEMWRDGYAARFLGSSEGKR
jgi:transcriptional regulator with XRE-family HTH domain